jgi:ABC-type branched-subunit amino acid transport system substrate-binding protein
MRARERWLCGGLRSRLCAAVIFLIPFALLTASCVRTADTRRIALLAPFEGRYRDIGYDALYAARLALNESSTPRVELLAVDDGGASNAASRFAALQADPLVIAILALGPFATEDSALSAAASVPVMVAGSWRTPIPSAHVFWLTGAIDAQTDDRIFYASLRPLMDIWSQRRQSVTYYSSLAPPDDSFVERYQRGQPFAPSPTPLAALVYDAMRVLVQSAEGVHSRSAMMDAIGASDYPGYSGRIRFRDGQWADAPVRAYSVTIHSWVPADDSLEPRVSELWAPHRP